MKTVAILIGALFLSVSTASAQTAAANSGNQFVAASFWQSNAELEPAATPSVLTAELMPLTPILAPGSPARASLPAAAPAEPPQGVQGVFAKSDWQAYVGYSFLRFYEVPNQIENENGFNVSGAYYFRSWIAADGELLVGFSSQSGVSSRFLLAAVGPRLRWSIERGPEVWVHVLVGAAYLSPKTVYGSDSALGYQVGGGVDINTRHRRVSYRLQVDMVGTRFFSTYQYSPKISAGIVLKF